MEHWTQQYIGMKYRAKHFDCAHFVEAVMLQQFGRVVNLECYRPTLNEDRSKEMQEAIQTNIFAVCRETDKRDEGIGVLMEGAGHLDHIGILVYPGRPEVPYILHNFIKSRMSQMHKATEIIQFGLKIKGYYEWI